MGRLRSELKEKMIYEICANYGDNEAINPEYWKYIDRYNTKENHIRLFGYAPSDEYFKKFHNRY